MADKYSYPGTNILINLFNERDPDELELLESGLTGLRLAELQIRPFKGKFDLNHLQKIHKYIFQDLYPFAGELRNVNIIKDSFHFAHAPFIFNSANELFSQLKSENYLKGLSRKEFSVKAAKYFSDINILHPFREGNGRTQREFIRSLAGKNGFKLKWSQVNSTELLHASIKAVNNETTLAVLIEKCILNEIPDRSFVKLFTTVNKRNMEIER